MEGPPTPHDSWDSEPAAACGEKSLPAAEFKVDTTFDGDTASNTLENPMAGGEVSVIGSDVVAATGTTHGEERTAVVEANA
jgi:hypothetical protein